MSDWIVNTDEIGELFGIQRRHVYNLVKKGMPQAGKARYHVPTVIQWYIDEKSGGSAADITEQRKLLYKAQTDKTELDNQQIRGELLQSGVVQTAFLELGTRIRTQIESIEPRLARMLPQETVIALRSEIKAALETIADDISTYADTRDSSRDHPPAT